MRAQSGSHSGLECGGLGGLCGHRQEEGDRGRGHTDGPWSRVQVASAPSSGEKRLDRLDLRVCGPAC